MKFHEIIDRIYPKDPATKRRERADRLRHFHDSLRAAWADLPESTPELSRKVDRSYGRTFTADERVAGIVWVLATGVQQRGSYYAIDAASSKLNFDNSHPYIQVHALKRGPIERLYLTSVIMSYISGKG